MTNQIAQYVSFFLFCNNIVIILFLICEAKEFCLTFEERVPGNVDCHIIEFFKKWN